MSMFKSPCCIGGKS